MTTPNVRRIKVILRPALRRFAEQMELKLRDNDHKGGWKECSNNYLLKRLLEEYQELLKTLAPGGLSFYTTDEAVDVANFAMMIADNARNW